MSKLHKNEGIKTKSNYLRGTIGEGLSDTITGAISEDDTQLIKFHGMYQQDDRDIRAERAKKKLEKAYSFMIRVRIAGGVMTPKQYLKMDEIAQTYAGNSIRLTTRQAIQFHGVIKNNLKATMKAIDSVVMDTIAACGDVNRNVMCNPNPYQSKAHEAAQELATKISNHLTPNTAAYREIWLDGEKISTNEEPIEPIYGQTYLPRKFKTVVAVPPSNDVDVYAHDLGFIAVLDEKENVTGWTISVGGGMGMTHGDTMTFPRTADLMGICEPEDALQFAEAVVTTQRDWGNREIRANARLKYTIETHGLENFRAEVEKRVGKKLKDPEPIEFTSNGDRYGWVENGSKSHLTLFIQNGRVSDFEEGPQILTGLREIAKIHDGDFRVTANQNIIIANISKKNRKKIEKLVKDYSLTDTASSLRRNAMACVAFPTCGLALAESERYLPSLITKLDDLLAKHKLNEQEIVIRMTGCPNGCARPYIAEIGFVGKGPGKYNMYLGGAFTGERLSKLYSENVTEEEILTTLDKLFAHYSKDKKKNEYFGDFLIRAGFVKETTAGNVFHKDTGPLKAA